MKIVQPETVLHKLKPGMSIFLGTGVSEPRLLVRHLLTSHFHELDDLELVQLVSYGHTSTPETIHERKFRLRTFFSGYVAKEITSGRVDLIPIRFARLPHLFRSRLINVDAAFIQITPPDKSGYCSFGVSIDVARLAMEQANLVVGEINHHIPITLGDTFAHVSEFDFLIESAEKPIYFTRWQVDETFAKLAGRIVSLIEDGSCLSFSIGPLFEALTPYLKNRKHLGIHSPIITDALMELVESGAVSNRFKASFLGKSLASYAFGGPKLFSWLDRNPMVEFQSIEHVFNPINIGANSRFVVIIPARKVDLSGRIVLHSGVGNVATGPIELLDFFKGAEISDGGRSIFGLPSRNRQGKSNILLSVAKYQNQFGSEESLDIVVTEFGAANLKGLTIRERAQSLIDIAHPEDREKLVEQAKKKKLLYPNQIFIPESSFLYPDYISERQRFKGNLEVRFRPIRPSDEEQMRRLFYRFSDQDIYARYFANVQSMPHDKMQEYVNVNWNDTMSVVGLTGPLGQGRIIAEGRFIKIPTEPHAELAFVVDEEFQNRGITSYLLKLITRIARKKGVKSFTFEVLFSNTAMMRVFKKNFNKVEATLEEGIYNVSIPLD
ncbi:MAG: GNAT family N-acetyltransferase [Desulfocapsaceae bacterium]|nr:GNAT family N-acetyltransferase [Desulfocapsaceae bacterium]